MNAPLKPGEPVPQIHDNVAEMLAEAGLSADAARALIDFDTAYFQLTRLVAKGEMLTAILARIGADLDPALFQGATAIIRIRCGVGRAPTEPTIGLVAEELAIDPSRASRIVAELVSRGYVLRGAAQDDGRKSVLEITPKGWTMLDRFRREKWQIMARVFSDWDPETITHFARGIRAYYDGIHAEISGMRSPD